MDGGLGNRDRPSRRRVSPRPHRLELGLGEGAGQLRGRGIALPIRQFRQHIDREDADGRVPTSL